MNRNTWDTGPVLQSGPPLQVAAAFTFRLPPGRLAGDGSQPHPMWDPFASGEQPIPFDTSPPESRKPIGRPPTRVERRCSVPSCGGVFLAKPGELARGGGRYCSAVCRSSARRKGATIRLDLLVASVPVRPRPPGAIALACATCGITFRVHPNRARPGRQAKFCSKACAGTRPRGPRPKRSARRESQFGGLACETCGQAVHAVTASDGKQGVSTGVKRWCSIECTAAYFGSK